MQLRVLMYLALKEDRLATIAEIAKSYGISKSHLMKVAHGLGIDFLLEGAVDRKGTGYDGPVGALASQGVEFRVCNNTLTQRNIPASKLLLETKVVPAGVVEVTRLQQQEGFAYLKP